MLFTDIRFNAAEMRALYDDYRGNAYVDLRERFEPGYRERNERLLAGVTHMPLVESFLKPLLNFPVTLLDWGGDIGVNTPFKIQAERMDIFDIHSKPPLPGINRVKAGEIRDDYTLIVCAHVLEHLPYPVNTLREIAGHMRPDTILYVETPFEEVIRNGEPEKTRWHEHINFFTIQSLGFLLARAGLRLEKWQARALDDGTHVFMLACGIGV